ncbi:thioredoxin family protein [Evansella sp. AB-P1]|uniref:thioredoxin family protein n=1 Tax=Evansella sp. AB-P1 TaxID=3037653 RepID=UPI00241D4170|nr:thioredoxin family protein [Evansella sp. AB-P1]MDG5787542.1 thioredoxin family protein [Evansella sp. AB-P1]
MNKLMKEEELEHLLLKKSQSCLVFFHTPMCGTCQLARSFLNVIEKVEGVPEIYELDLNYFVTKAVEWEIESVPCLVHITVTNKTRKLYAFESVTNIFQFIKGE